MSRLDLLDYTAMAVIEGYIKSPRSGRKRTKKWGR